MALQLQKILTTKLTLKISACILGIFFWSIAHQSHTTTITRTIPLYVYNTTEHQKITAPETIQVTLSGPCALIRTIDYKTLAAHINAQKIKPHTSYYLQAHDLLLPKGINLVDYIPGNLGITIEQRKEPLV